MNPSPFDVATARSGLALVGGPTRRDFRDPAARDETTGDEPGTGTPAPCERTIGDICVYFEPGGTVVRLFGRVDQSMRRELVEAAFDVVGRGGRVTIDLAPDAHVDPRLLSFLHRVCDHPVDGDAGGLSAADQLRSPHARPRSRPPAGRDAGRRVPAAR